MLQMDEQYEPAEIGFDIFSEFLEVAIHCILHSREIYPAGVFEKRKKYNVPVQMCKHPDVSMYITQVVNGVTEFNRDGHLEEVAIVIFNSKGEPVEKFVLEIAKPSQPQNQQPDRYLYQLEQCLRSFLLKINMADSLLKPLPPECTWSVQVTTKESATAKMFEKSIEEDFPWLEADDREKIVDNASIVPLKSASSSYLNMQMFVEENQKGKV